MVIKSNIPVLSADRQVASKKTNKLVIFIFGFLVGLVFLVLRADTALAVGFSLDPEVITVESGEEFSVNVMIQSEGVSADGADIILNYNLEKLEAKEVKPGTAFKNYPVMSIGEGTVRISAIADSTGPFFSGSDLFAEVRFKALEGGEETISIDFTNDSTVDSNVALHGKGVDGLSEVGGAVLYIGGSSGIADTAKNSISGRVFLILLYVIVVLFLGILFYLWWRRRSSKKDIFIPEPAPLDRPPEG